MIPKINLVFLKIQMFSGPVLLQLGRGLHWPSHPPTRCQSVCQRWAIRSCGGRHFYHIRRGWRRSAKQQGIRGRDEKQAKTWVRKTQGHWSLQLFDRCHQMCQIDPQDSHWGRGTRDLSLRALTTFLCVSLSPFSRLLLFLHLSWKVLHKKLWFSPCLWFPKTTFAAFRPLKKHSQKCIFSKKYLWVFPCSALSSTKKHIVIIAKIRYYRRCSWRYFSFSLQISINSDNVNKKSFQGRKKAQHKKVHLCNASLSSLSMWYVLLEKEGEKSYHWLPSPLRRNFFSTSESQTRAQEEKEMLTFPC